MIRQTVGIALLSLVSVLAGCVSVEFEGSEQAVAVDPRDADELARDGDLVVWGGQIAAIFNAEDETELQVIGYPLNSGNVPDIDTQSTGRFIVVHSGYLEPNDFAPGRWVSLAGRLDGTSLIEQGEYSRSVPLVRSDQIHLWSRYPSNWYDNVNLGVGVSVVR